MVMMLAGLPDAHAGGINPERAGLGLAMGMPAAWGPHASAMVPDWRFSAAAGTPADLTSAWGRAGLGLQLAPPLTSAESMLFRDLRIGYRHSVYESSNASLSLGASARWRESNTQIADVGVDVSLLSSSPRLSMGGEYRFAPRWRLAFDVDAMGAQRGGYAYEAYAGVGYRLADTLDAGLGLRLHDQSRSLRDGVTLPVSNTLFFSLGLRY